VRPGVVAQEAASVRVVAEEGSEVAVVEKLNHFLHLEDPAAVNKRILEFVTAK